MDVVPMSLVGSIAGHVNATFSLTNCFVNAARMRLRANPHCGRDYKEKVRAKKNIDTNIRRPNT